MGMYCGATFFFFLLGGLLSVPQKISQGRCDKVIGEVGGQSLSMTVVVYSVECQVFDSSLNIDLLWFS